MSKQTSTLFSNHTPCQRGDIWQLAGHRLMCGDSTNADDVTRLFAGDRFRLCFTSPPYTDQRTYKLGEFNWHSLMVGTFKQIVVSGVSDCHILINLGLSHKNRQVDMYWLSWLMICAEMGWPLFGWYVWDKMSARPRANDGRLSIFHEFIFHFNNISNPANKWLKKMDESLSRPHAKFRYADGTIRDATGSRDTFAQPFKTPNSVIRIMSEQSRGIHTANHPAVFPVALPEFVMQTWSHPSDIVYEPFCGSGTSIIAGQNLERRVYAMEIEPTYCDLTIQRWQEYTGQQATLIDRVERSI